MCLSSQPQSFDNIDFNTIQFKHLTSTEGLAHNRVHSAIMDDQGYMWFGTQDGLSRWDGFSIKTYYPRLGDSTAISGSLVTDIAKDKNGCLWIVSHQGDLCKYDPRSELFKTYHYPEFDNGIVLTSEMEVFIDSEDLIWIGCFDDGFVRFDPTSEKYKRFDVVKNLSSDDDRVRKNSVLVITEDKDDPNQLWLGTNNGLFSFSKDSEDVKEHASAPYTGITGAVRGIQIDKDGNLWLATLGSGLAKYNQANNKWDFFVPNEEMWKQFNFSVNYIHDFEYKSPTEFWVSSGEYGSGTFNIETEEYTFFKSLPGNPTAISSERGFKVYVDPNGRVWWMHENRGISYMEEECQIFHFNDFRIPNEQSSWNRFLADFAIDTEAQKIYGVGHLRDGLFEIDHKNGKSKRLSTKGFEGNMNQYDAVLSTSFGELLVGGFHNEDSSYDDYVFSPLLHLDKGLQQLVPFRPDRFKDLQSKNINDIYEDAKGSIWIASDDGYLFCYNHKEDSVEKYYLKAEHGAGINYIVESEKAQKLFCATFDGIYSFDLIDKRFEVIKGTEEFSSRGICLSQDDSLLWIGTRQLGIQCYDIAKDALISIGEYRNAPRTPVEKVFVDKNKGVWATTERGLYLLDSDLSMFYDFNARNGISEDYFYSQGVLLLDDGTILLGQQGGYYFFNPEELNQTLDSGPAVIADLLVNQQDVIKEVDDTGNPFLNLRYNENSVSVGFSSISYCQQDKVLFEYMLEGLEEDWLIPLNGVRTINYPSLRSGNYTFKVKKLGDDENIASIDIKITPPFWRSWLAYLIYVLAILYLINWIFSAKLRQQKEKEDLRVKISSDIHDDVGSLLAGLAMESETMALGKVGEEKESLLNISKTGREAIDRLRDIVWVLDSRRDKYENLLDRMKHFADSKFRPTKFEYSFDVGKLSDQQFISPDLRQNFYLVFKEAVTNLLKHSNGDKAKIYFGKENSKLVLKVFDNGSNNEIAKSDGLGLENMKMRADKVGGKLTINNKDGFEVKLEVYI